jgi:hypothetical protein
LKKLSAILLLFTLTAPFPGTYIFLQYNKNKIKKEITGMIDAGLEKKDLVLLMFTNEETETILNWKHSREFEYKGQLYDIVEKRQDGDTISYKCYKDHKETRLNREKDQLLAGAMGQDPCRKSQTEKIVNFIKIVFRQDAFSWKPDQPQPSIFDFSLFVFRFSLFSPSPPSPPPKYA